MCRGRLRLCHECHGCLPRSRDTLGGRSQRVQRRCPGAVPRLAFHRLQGARGGTTAEQALVVPTEVYDPALHPSGPPTWFACREPARVAHYEVHDDNAFVMNGVAGHAGLFASATAMTAMSAVRR